MRRCRLFTCLFLTYLLLKTGLCYGAETQSDWDRTLTAAKQEGTLVVGIPASATLRNQLTTRFAEKFGIGLETLSARGPENVTRIMSEFTAGVRYFDLVIAGGVTPLPLVAAGATDPLEPYMILSEVKEAKNWWGGHVWEDNVSTNRFIYAFQCNLSETYWQNLTMAGAQKVRSFDEFLEPKWQGKIGLLDPRVPGSGQNSWTFLWKIKGEAFLRKLAQQNLLITQNQRQLAEGLAKGTLGLTMGVTFYTFEPFLKAGLPVGPIRNIKEGNQASNGSGVITVLKNPPHPNATKIFVNWLLSKEGQEMYGKIMVQGTRRLDVNTDWLKESGVEACKDVMKVEDYRRWETHSEAASGKYRKPAIALAKSLFN